MKWINFLNKLFNKNRRHNILEVTFVLILILSFGLISNTINVPVINNIFYKNHRANLNAYDDYLEVVGKSKECNGIMITLESAIADENILMFSFLVENKNEEITNLIDADINISSLEINGRKAHLISKNNLESINSNTARIVKRLSWHYDNLPKNLNISIGIEKMFGIKGNWDIKFNVDTDKILEETEEEEINSNLNVLDLKGTIEKVIISPLTIKIDTIYKSYNKSKIGFLVLNENDDELMTIEEDTFKNLNQYKYISTYVDDEPLENLKIIPIYYGSNKEEILVSNRIDLEEFHQFYLNIIDNLSIKIEDCIIDGEYTILKYNYEYMGKVITADLNKLYIKCDDVIYEEKQNEEINSVKNKYLSDEYKISIFKFINNGNLEIGCYDGTNSKLLEDYTFNVEKEKD